MIVGIGILYLYFWPVTFPSTVIGLYLVCHQPRKVI